MKLRRLIFVSSLVLAVAALSPAAAFGAANGTNRPLKGSGSGSGTVTLVGGVPATLVTDGTFHSSHLGLSTFHVDGVCTNPACSTLTFTSTVVAANGDTLTSTGTSTGTTATTFTRLETFTGGTGRFAGASGTSTTTGTFVADPSNPLAFTFTFTISGTISY